MSFHFLATPLKSTAEVDLVKPLNSYIQSVYNTSEDDKSEIAEAVQVRIKRKIWILESRDQRTFWKCEREKRLKPTVSTAVEEKTRKKQKWIWGTEQTADEGVLPATGQVSAGIGRSAQVELSILAQNVLFYFPDTSTSSCRSRTKSSSLPLRTRSSSSGRMHSTKAAFSLAEFVFFFYFNFKFSPPLLKI